MAAGSTDSLARATRAALAAVGALEEVSGELCRLDSAAGDGDHGLAMAAAAEGVRKKLSANPSDDVAGLLRLAAGEFAAAGGAMGAISYVLLQAVADVVDEIQCEFLAPDVARLLFAAKQAASEFGGAGPGDKTVIDAIAAAHEAASDVARSGGTSIDCLLAAAEGARKGAEATADMVARVGRASRLGELSRGTVDPGAKSFAVALQALATAYEMEDRS